MLKFKEFLLEGDVVPFKNKHVKQIEGPFTKHFSFSDTKLKKDKNGFTQHSAEIKDNLSHHKLASHLSNLGYDEVSSEKGHTMYHKQNDTSAHYVSVKHNDDNATHITYMNDGPKFNKKAKIYKFKKSA